MKKQKKRTTWRKFQFISQDGSNSVPSKKSMKQASARLRKLRWKIYHERKKSRVGKLLDEYNTCDSVRNNTVRYEVVYCNIVRYIINTTPSVILGNNQTRGRRKQL